ncbi:MAG: hypothetical protein EPN34_03065 [Burkholderiaceae bacterium]|nr:MAG: hypothetical protein EPN34_03065 [Burkholderiaceae bacterium]
MTVRAKFRCDSTKPSDSGNVIVLTPVTGGSSENDSFFRYTPGGLIQLSVVNDAAAAQFVLGAEYYVDFTPVNTEG